MVIAIESDPESEISFQENIAPADLHLDLAFNRHRQVPSAPIHLCKTLGISAHGSLHPSFPGSSPAIF